MLIIRGQQTKPFSLPFPPNPPLCGYTDLSTTLAHDEKMCGMLNENVECAQTDTGNHTLDLLSHRPVQISGPGEG
jgi:hypothetical protein